MQKLLKNVRVLDVKSRKIEFFECMTLENGALKPAKYNEDAHDAQKYIFIPKLVDNFCDLKRAKDRTLPHVLESEKPLRKSYEKVCDFSNFETYSKNPKVFLGEINGQKVLYFEDIANLEERELDELLELSVKEGRLPIIRTADSLYDAGAIDKRFNKSAVKVLDDFGFFDRPCVLLGASEVDKDDLEILSRQDVKVITTISENMFLQKGLLNAVNFRNYGLYVRLRLGRLLS